MTTKAWTEKRGNMLDRRRTRGEGAWEGNVLTISSFKGEIRAATLNLRTLIGGVGGVREGG